MLGVTLSHTVCVCRISLGGEGNVLYPVMSSFYFDVNLITVYNITCLLCWQVTYQPVSATLHGSQQRPVAVSNVQQLSVSGSKFQYVRLVSTTAPTQLTARSTGPPGTHDRLLALLHNTEHRLLKCICRHWQSCWMVECRSQNLNQSFSTNVQKVCQSFWGMVGPLMITVLPIYCFVPEFFLKIGQYLMQLWS